MRTTEIIKGLNQNELLKWESETKSILSALNWKLTKTERALYLHQSGIDECKEKLQAYQKRAVETRMALQFLSETHPLRHKCEDEMYRTEIKIFRLENKLKRFSSLKSIQLEIKKVVLAEEIRYYEGVLTSIENMLWSTVVLRRVMDTPDVDMVRDTENVFHFQHSEPVGNRAFQPTKDKISRKLEMTTFLGRYSKLTG